MALQIDVRFIQPFIAGTIQTLKVQCNLEARQGQISVRYQQDAAPPIDIAGLIGLTSPTFKGSIALGFPEATFLGIMNQLLGEKNETVTKDMEDGAGELINIIFGVGKKTLNEKGHSLQMALPSIVKGKNIKVSHLAPFPVMVIPFETDIGHFYVEVAAETVSKKTAA